MKNGQTTGKSSVQDFKMGMDSHTKYTIKKLTRKNKNKGLLQLTTITSISNSTTEAKKGCCKDDKLHAQEQTGTTTARVAKRCILQARECGTRAALKPSLKNKLKPDPH